MQCQSRAPYFLYVMKRVLKVIETVCSIDLEPLLFVHGDARVKSIRNC
jgi:hypothetical protein